jgi:hypothetical protein
MRQIKNSGDDRNNGFCVHCGGLFETDDHAPSKVFLDDPFPENLSASPSCAACNNGFSKDEEYLACFLECVMSGTTDPEGLIRPNIANRMRRSPKLRERIESCRQVVGDQIIWNPETGRVKRILLKLARCHVAFEFNEPRLDKPTRVNYKPLQLMKENERKRFESVESLDDRTGWPEVGSRAMSRLLVFGSSIYDEGWLNVQDERYRFLVSQDDGLIVRMVIRGYLACEVVWH